MLWTDNLMIPKAAAHKGTAELMINYYYDPAVSAVLTAGRRLHLAGQGHRRADDRGRSRGRRQQVRDPAARTGSARLHIFGALSEEDELYFNEQFAKVIGVA